MKKSAVSAANMEVLLVHAVVQPKVRTGEVAGETRAAQALGVHLMGLVRELPAVRTWRARAADGRQVALQVMADSASAEEKEHFARAVAARKTAVQNLVGVLPVHAIAEEGAAFQTDLWTTGNAKDLPALQWPLRRRLEFVAAVAASLQALHDAGIVHGCLCADNVLLDDKLQPILSEAGLVMVPALIARGVAGIYDAFVAPEVREGAEPDVRADVYSLGRLLQEIAGDDAYKTPNVAEILRTATAPLAAGRFATIASFAAALTLAVDSMPTETPQAAAPAPALVPDAKPPKREPSRPTFSFDEKREPSAPWRAPTWLGLAGVIAMGGSVVCAALLGGSSDPVREALGVAVPLGAAAATTLLPPLPRKGTLARIALAVGVAMLVLLVDPLAFGYRLAAQARMRGGADGQRAAVAEVMRIDRDFRGLSLSGAQLAGVDLTAADLRNVSLAGADLSGARLFGAWVEGASFDGAQLSGADLTDVNLVLASAANANCDAATRLPPGWRCADGRVARN